MVALSHIKGTDFDWRCGDQPLGLGSLCCAIGNFDGVHKGHQILLAKAKHIAERMHLPFGVVTFTPHPRCYFTPSAPPFLLMRPETKTRTLKACGADLIITIYFDEALQTMPAQIFACHVLAEAFSIRHLVVGADFVFGAGRSGTVEHLKQWTQITGMHITSIELARDQTPDHAPDRPQDWKGKIYSSTAIRQALAQGDIAQAASMLGRAPQISGLVVKGDQRGRQLAFPTANIKMDQLMPPAYGVYAVTAELGNKRIVKGVANIGQRPTVNYRGVLCEVHLFDFDEDIYGQELVIHLQYFLRPERIFDGLTALKAQIAQDVAQAKNRFAKNRV